MQERPQQPIPTGGNLSRKRASVPGCVRREQKAPRRGDGGRSLTDVGWVAVKVNRKVILEKGSVFDADDAR